MSDRALSDTSPTSITLWNAAPIDWGVNLLRLNGRLGPGSGKASRGHDEKSDVRVEGEFDVELFSPGSSPAIGDAEFGGLSSAFRSSGFFFFYQSSLPGPGLSRAVVEKTGSVLPMGSDVVDSPSRNLRCHVVQCSYILCNLFCLSGSVRII